MRKNLRNLSIVSCMCKLNGNSINKIVNVILYMQLPEPADSLLNMDSQVVHVL